MVFGANHELNRAEISNLEPISYVQELEGTLLAIKTADINNIVELLIITDNLAAMNTAQMVINEPNREDYDKLAGENQSVSKLLEEISKRSKGKKIVLQHIHYHKSLPGQFSTLNALAESLCKRELDLAFQPLSDSSQTDTEVS